jgi:hypothetical protein
MPSQLYQRITLAGFVLLSALILSTPCAAQSDTTDLLSLLGEEEITNYTAATFKSTRVINGQSVENAAGGVLDFRISHRFGPFNSGPHRLWGLDLAQIRLGFEYGINDRLMVGIGRSNVNEEIDGFTKIKLLRQSSGSRNMPISLSWFSSMVLRATEWADPDRKNYFSSRLFFCHQLLMARKFNERLSLQLSPTAVHRNMVPNREIKNTVLAAGFGGRYKLTQRTAFNAEYFYVLPNQLADNFYNSFSLGFDIETGGHVFQLHITNSNPMNEKGFITETTGQWSKGDIQFGFNVSRVFTVKRKKSVTE